MDSAELRSFLVIAELGNLSRAAERLSIGQPALGRQIKHLEAELGTPVFERFGDGVSLTHAGRFLLKRAEDVIRDLDAAKQRIKESGAAPGESLTLAVAPSLGHDLVPKILERLPAFSESVGLNVVSGTDSDFGEWLQEGSVDLALMYDFAPMPPFEVTPVASEELCLFFKPASLDIDKEFLAASDLAEIPLVLPDSSHVFTRNLERWMGNQGYGLRTVCNVGDESILRACVIQGQGAAVLAKGSFALEIQQGLVRRLPLRPEARRKVTIVHSINHPRLDLHTLFAQFVYDVAVSAMDAGSWQADPLPDRPRATWAQPLSV